MSEYRPIELLKTAKDLCAFDAICVGGPLHGAFRSLGKLPMQNICEVVESHHKSPIGNMRAFSYRLTSHMKYRLTLLRRRGMVFVAWVHESVPVAIHSELLANFDAAIEFSKLNELPEEEAIEAAPFEPGDRVAPNGGYAHEAVTVNRCFYRDGQWRFIPMWSDNVSHECRCWVKVAEHKAPPTFDTESENAAKDATPDPKHKVLSDAEMFGPTQLFQTTNNNGENVTYGIDWSKLDLMSYASKPKSGPEYAASFLTNRTVAPFRVGQMVRWKSKGTAHIVEAIKYVESEKCWAIRIPGHDRPYNASMFEASGQVTAEVNVAPPPDPQPLGRRPRRNIIRKERPHD